MGSLGEYVLAPFAPFARGGGGRPFGQKAVGAVAHRGVQLMDPVNEVVIAARRVVGRDAVDVDAVDDLLGSRAGKIAGDDMDLHVVLFGQCLGQVFDMTGDAANDFRWVLPR